MDTRITNSTRDGYAFLIVDATMISLKVYLQSRLLLNWVVKQLDVPEFESWGSLDWIPRTTADAAGPNQRHPELHSPRPL